jgi:Ca-activated chloride channel family protein
MGRVGSEGAGMRSIIATLALVAAAGGAQEGTIFRTDVQLVRLLVTVKNANDELIGSLGKKDFTVADCGVPQEIAVFERQTAQTLSVSLMIDISGSTAKDLRYEVTSIGKFLSAMFHEGNPEDAVALYSFNYDVTQLTAFTRNQQRLNDRLRTVRPEGGTSMYDAIHLVARGLEPREGRHVMVIVTDGGDTTSALKYKDAFEGAQRADAVIFGIVVIPITNDAGRNLGGERALEQLAHDTGGRVFRPDAEHLDTAFTDLLQAIRTQYLIGYYPRKLPRDAPRFHPVKVEVQDKSLRVSTRSGYYEDAKH